MEKRTVVMLVHVCVVLFTGAVQGERVAVSSLSTVVADAVREVGGDRVDLVEVIKAGMDPHAFHAGPRDIAQIAKAQLVLMNGLGMEAGLGELRSAVGPGPRFFVAGEVIEPMMVEGAGCEHEGHDHGEHAGHEHGGAEVPDPHWWHSVANMKLVVGKVRDTLVELEPEGRAEYEANAAGYIARLDELERWARVRVAAIPKRQRVLVTSHDALGYFARDYGFEVIAVQGLSTDDQPGSKAVKELIGRLRDSGVRAIFAENIENPKVLEEITRETGARVGGVLYADGLGSGEAATYEGMFRSNVSTIVAALVPE